jgi:hypothetical protein
MWDIFCIFAISFVVDYPRFEPLTANTREEPKIQKSQLSSYKLVGFVLAIPEYPYFV